MLTQFSRTELLFGKEAMDKLAGSKVAVFGIGGVGGYVCEALVRSGLRADRSGQRPERRVCHGWRGENCPQSGVFPGK